MEIKKGFSNNMKNQNLIIIAPLVNGIYVISVGCVSPNNAMSLVTQSDKLELWHMRLSHLGEKRLELISKGVFGKDNVHKLTFCEHYILGKQNRLTFKAGTHKSLNVVDYIHRDMWGPALVSIVSDYRYYLLNIDDFSRKV